MTSRATQPGNRDLEGRNWRSEIGKLRRSPVVMASVAALIVAAMVILIRSDGWLQPAELMVYDALRAAAAGAAPSRRVVLVGATEQDITETDANGDRVWGWPLRDGSLAALLQRLASW